MKYGLRSALLIFTLIAVGQIYASESDDYSAGVKSPLSALGNYITTTLQRSEVPVERIEKALLTLLSSDEERHFAVRVLKLHKHLSSQDIEGAIGYARNIFKNAQDCSMNADRYHSVVLYAQDNGFELEELGEQWDQFVKRVAPEPASVRYPYMFVVDMMNDLNLNSKNAEFLENVLLFRKNLPVEQIPLVIRNLKVMGGFPTGKIEVSYGAPGFILDPRVEGAILDTKVLFKEAAQRGVSPAGVLAVRDYQDAHPELFFKAPMTKEQYKELAAKLLAGEMVQNNGAASTGLF